jgi:LPS-assembly lipoprotein
MVLMNTSCGMPVARLPAACLLVCLTVMLSACGFQLRGSATLPQEMKVTYIKAGNPYGTLVNDFAEALRTHKVTVTEDSQEATATLVIIKNTRDKDVLSVNRNGKVLEYQLSQSIQFSVKTGDNVSLLEPQQVSMSRDYLYNSTDVLSKEREEAVVRRTLQRELVNLAILRMSAVAN